MNKADIITRIIAQFDGNIKELELSLEDYKSASNLDEGDTMDPDDYSKQSEQKEMQYSMQIQLDHAKAGLNQLKEFSTKKFSVAKSGALIETDKNLFLMGIAFPTIRIDDKELVGISQESPAFNMLNGKSIDDTFTLGKNNYAIKNIY